jgi:hypothetical protein
VHVIVKNGTRAGRKKSFRGRAPDWFCRCVREVEVDEPELFKKQKGHLKRCNACATDRPT